MSTTLLKPHFRLLIDKRSQKEESDEMKLIVVRDWSKSIGGDGPEQRGVGHEVLSLVKGVCRAIFSYP